MLTTGKFDEALPIYKDTLRAQLALVGPRDPVVAVTMASLVS